MKQIMLVLFFSCALLWSFFLKAEDLTELEEGAYQETAERIGPLIDQLKNDNKLSETRSLINEDQVDRCFENELYSHQTLSLQTSYFTSKMFKETNAFVGMVGPMFGAPEDDSQYAPISLISHPLCKVTKKTLEQTLKNVPSEAAIAKLNKWSQKLNELRTLALNGDTFALHELLSSWSSTFSCLAYTESLSSADSAASIKVAQKYSPKGYRKPAAVEFYEDPYQPKESRLNIGLYQFTPNAAGNVRPCIKAWNELFKDKGANCQIKLNSTQQELIKALGSSRQSFNAFCGIHKIIETFAIQVNTKKTAPTHPDNRKDGKLLAPKDRCVSPHFSAGRAYNHFGPFQNSTDNNLDKLYTCVLKTLEN